MYIEFNERISVDTQIFNYLVQSLEIGYDPKNDRDKEITQKNAKEREAIYHIFRRSEIFVPLIVKQEYRNIKDKIILQKREKSHLILFRDIDKLDKSKVERLKYKFYQRHKKNNDCLALAEAEVGGMDYFLTFDTRLKKNLQSLTKINIFHPSELWRQMKILKIKEKIFPDPLNPHSQEKWRQNP